MKRLRFKPPHAKTLAQNRAAERYLATFAPAEKMAAAAERVEQLEAQSVGAPVKRERAAPRDLEGPVVKAIGELLAVHPCVIWAARFNSGAASYEAASGRYAPVWFHRFLRAPEKMRMPDFFGLARFYRGGEEWKIAPIAIEAKPPSWTKPRDEREREQAAFLAMIRAAGGIGIFATDEQQVADALGSNHSEAFVHRID